MNNEDRQSPDCETDTTSDAPWSQPDADPLRDMYEAGEASRRRWHLL